MTLEGRPSEPFPWRINGLRAFSGQANRLLTLHNRYIKPGSYNRVSKKTANRPKVPRRMIGRRRGVPPLLDPTRPLKRPPIPPGALPLGLRPSPQEWSAYGATADRSQAQAPGKSSCSSKGGQGPLWTPQLSRPRRLQHRSPGGRQRRLEGRKVERQGRGSACQAKGVNAPLKCQEARKFSRPRRRAGSTRSLARRRTRR